MSLSVTIYKVTGEYVKTLDLNSPDEVALNLGPDETAVEGAHGELTWLAGGEVLTRPSIHHVLLPQTGEWVDGRDDEQIQEYNEQVGAAALADLDQFATAEIASLSRDYRLGEGRQYADLVADATAWLSAYDAAVAAGGDLPGWDESIPLRGMARFITRMMEVTQGTVSVDQVRDILVYYLRDLVENNTAWRKRVAIIDAEVNFRRSMMAMLPVATDQTAAIEAEAEAGRAAIIALRDTLNSQLDLLLNAAEA